MCGVNAPLQERKRALVESKGKWPHKGHQRAREEGPVRAWK